MTDAQTGQAGTGMTTSVNQRRALLAQVSAALRTVDDPEYPGLSIVDLGLVEEVDVDWAGNASIGLIPTFSGCPALALIATDVESAILADTEVAQVSVHWLSGPAWTVDRLTDHARLTLADQFTVAVQIGIGPVACPRCGSATEQQSMFGPSRCRAVHRCQTCREAVEVMRK